MPFVFPQVLDDKHKRYRTLRRQGLFRLQKERKGVRRRRIPYRIVLEADSHPQVVLVALSGSQTDQLDKEWSYIVEELVELVPGGLDEPSQLSWLVTHFNVLYAHEYDSSTALNLPEISINSIESSESKGIQESTLMHYLWTPQNALKLLIVNLLIALLHHYFASAVFVAMLVLFNTIVLHAPMFIDGRNPPMFIEKKSHSQIKPTVAEELVSTFPSKLKMTPGKTLLQIHSLTQPTVRVEKFDWQNYVPLSDVEMERKNRNGVWETLPSSLFEVREGPNYKQYKRKAPSGQSLYDVVAVDVFQSRSKIKRVHRYFDLSSLSYGEERSKAQLAYPEILVINVMAPLEAPALFSRKTDGKSFSTILFCRISEYSKEMIRTSKETPALQLFKKFCDSQDSKFLSRFKGIGRVVNVPQCPFGRILSSVVDTYNARPFLIQHPEYLSVCKGDGWIELDVDLHSFSSLVKSAFHHMQPVLPQIMADFGFLIEGRDDDELPETVLACFRCYNVQNIDAQPFPST